MKEDSVSNATLRERYLSIKQGSKTEYAILLTLIRRAGELSMNEAASLKGVAPQNIHVKLKRLEDKGLLAREKRAGRQNIKEYQYFLAEDIDPNELQKLTGDDLPPEINERLQQLLAGTPIDVAKPVDRIETVRPIMPKDQETQRLSFLPKTVADQLLNKLPDFDPTWPEDMQNRWMASFEAITRRIMEESDN